VDIKHILRGIITSLYIANTIPREGEYRLRISNFVTGIYPLYLFHFKVKGYSIEDLSDLMIK